MSRAPIPLCAASLAIVLSAAPAFAAIPSPGNCTVPTCIRVVPGGNIVTTVIVRDILNTPIPNSTVWLSYANCPGLVLCAGPGDPYFNDVANHRLVLATNPVGSAPFYIRGGGGCVNAGIDIFADAIYLGSARLASADQNGDLMVDPTDLAIETAKVGTSDLSGDLDCNGVVDNLDRGEVTKYIGNSCSDATPVSPRSWGKLKILYR